MEHWPEMVKKFRNNPRSKLALILYLYFKAFFRDSMAALEHDTIVYVYTDGLSYDYTIPGSCRWLLLILKPRLRLFIYILIV